MQSTAWPLMPAQGWLPAMTLGKQLAQSFWLLCYLQVIGSLLQQAEHVKKHPPLTLGTFVTMPRGHQLWAAAFRELMPALADGPSFHGSHSLANSSVHIYGPNEGFLDCNVAGAECWRQSALSGSTHRHDSQLLGLLHRPTLV